MQRVAAPFEMCFLRLQMEAKDEAEEKEKVMIMKRRLEDTHKYFLDQSSICI